MEYRFKRLEDNCIEPSELSSYYSEEPVRKVTSESEPDSPVLERTKLTDLKPPSK